MYSNSVVNNPGLKATNTAISIKDPTKRVKRLVKLQIQLYRNVNKYQIPLKIYLVQTLGKSLGAKESETRR